MPNLNKVQIIGNVGRDCDLRYSPAGTAISNFTVAVNYNRKVEDKWESETEWFNVQLFADLAERQSQYITKGRSVYVEGRLRTRSWDDDQGVKHKKVELIANQVILLDRKGEGDDTGWGSAAPVAKQEASEPQLPWGNN